MESQKCWENSGIVGSRAQPEMGTCRDAKEKSGATKEVPDRNQQCLLSCGGTGCNSHWAERVRSAQSGRMGTDRACGSLGNTTSQELPSGSQPLGSER